MRVITGQIVGMSPGATITTGQDTGVETVGLSENKIFPQNKTTFQKSNEKN